PRELAAELAGAAASLDVVERAEVAGPGFVNLWLGHAWFGEALGEMLERGEAYGGGWAATPERVQVEMVSANPTGPITVASARNGAYGDAVARLLAFGGHEVEREYYYNDAGSQMERFRESVEAVRRGEEPPPDGYHGAYIGELAALPGDPVPPMLARIEASLERFRVHFDSWARQSELAKRLPDLLPRLDTYEREGAVWARSSAYGDDEDRVLLRSDGGAPTYRAADVAYLVDKLDRGFDRAIYVLGADHHGTRNWYAAIARMLGADPSRVEVLLYQLVHLTRGGEQAKMSKRKGDVVFLDDFVDEVGVDAARWFLVNRGPDRTIEIDVDLAAERTQKNPVYYVQYAHARIAGILRKAGDAEVSAAVPETFEPEERALLKRLAELPGVAREAAERRGPQAVPEYAIQVADDFHRFYHEHRVLEAETRAFRLALCRATRNVIARCLDLVGVEAPERM
ncbi:MAG TPA: arginine--tRNA ligase, partial [Gaiellaceae bacterium]|nr:arginine--tRNA ligase [Gaiellaceae bacterium]